MMDVSYHQQMLLTLEDLDPACSDRWTLTLRSRKRFVLIWPCKFRGMIWHRLGAWLRVLNMVTGNSWDRADGNRFATATNLFVFNHTPKPTCFVWTASLRWPFWWQTGSDLCAWTCKGGVGFSFKQSRMARASVGHLNSQLRSVEAIGKRWKESWSLGSVFRYSDIPKI